MMKLKTSQNIFVAYVPDKKTGAVRQIAMSRHIHDDKYKVVIVDAAKFLASWSKQDLPILSAKDIQYWQRKFADSCAPPVAMPFVNVDRVIRVEKKLLGLIRTVSPGVAISFNNGRHRTAYLLSIGATYFPVIVDAEHADLLSLHCS